MPVALAGILKLAVKLPSVSVETADGLVVAGRPLYLMVTGLLELNPLPVIVTAVPEAPLAGVTVIFCPMVKGDVAELLLASWAFRVWIPRELRGMVKVLVLKLPLASVVVAVSVLILRSSR